MKHIVNSAYLEECEKTLQTIQENSDKNSLDTVRKNKRVHSKSSPKKTIIFLVYDDSLYLKALEHFISDKLPSITIKTFQTGEACLKQMKLKPEIIILDYYLDSNNPNAQDGLAILKQIKKTNSRTKVIMLSSQDSLKVATKCLDFGSFDYIAKNKSAFDNLGHVIMNIMGNIKITYTGMKPYQIIFFKENKIFLN